MIMTVFRAATLRTFFSRFHAGAKELRRCSCSEPISGLIDVQAVVVIYPTPSEGWGHGGKPWSPRSRATPQGLDQRSYRDRNLPKSERHKESVAGQCRMR